MNYENFVKEIHGEFEMLAERKGLSGRVVIRDVVKNNNVHLKSISVVNDENRATPTIYLESYYEEFCQGKDISDIFIPMNSSTVFTSICARMLF